jgi:hypothetical protein
MLPGIFLLNHPNNKIRVEQFRDTKSVAFALSCILNTTVFSWFVGVRSRYCSCLQC